MEKELLEEQVLATVTYYRFQVNVFLTICVPLRWLSCVLARACNRGKFPEKAVLPGPPRRPTPRGGGRFRPPGKAPAPPRGPNPPPIKKSPPAERECPNPQPKMALR